MALEAIADSGREAYDETYDEAYDFAIEGREPFQVDMRPMVRQIVNDMQGGESVNRIAARFHNTLVNVADDMCSRMRASTGLTRVCLAGGCFQNVRLLSSCVQRLRHGGFEVFFPQQVPINDGGIAFGQAAIACELTRRDG